MRTLPIAIGAVLSCCTAVVAEEVPSLWRPLAIGQFGTLSPFNSGREFGHFKTFQIVDENNALCYVGTWSTAGPAEELVWMQMPTKGFTDDKLYKSSDFYEVTSTKKYSTATGSKTVFVLKQLSGEEAKKKLEEYRVAKAQKEKEDTRIWTVGGRAYSAQYVRMINDSTVELKKKDGKTVFSPLNKLSKKDREWLENRTGRD